MPRTSITQDIAAPADAVWSVLANFADVSWIPAAVEVEVIGEGSGMRRLIHGAGEVPITETLVDVDPDARRLSYYITDNALPTSRFEAVVTVSAPDNSASMVTWDIDYDPIGDPMAVRESIEAVYGAMAGWLGEAAGRVEGRGRSL